LGRQKKKQPVTPINKSQNNIEKTIEYMKATIDASSSADNKKIAHDFYESYNEYDMQKSFDRFIAANLVNHTMGGSLDREKWLNFDKAFVAACPELRLTLKDQIGEGDKVVTHWIMEGTHTADFMGMPASGNSIVLEGISIDKIEEGKIKEHFAMADFTLFMQQFTKK
jgi:steroid delta-isomerase-like uncharacterized protein